MYNTCNSRHDSSYNDLVDLKVGAAVDIIAGTIRIIVVGI